MGHIRAELAAHASRCTTAELLQKPARDPGTAGRRAVDKLGLPRKREVPRAQEQDSPEVQEERRHFCEEMAGIEPRRPVFVDECGADAAMTRTDGRAPVGQRVYTDTPGHWESVTLTCGLRLSGVTAASAFVGTTNTGVLEDYVADVLVPELKPGNVVIWYDLKPHQSEEAFEAARARVLPLPPWSPDLTLLEEIVSKVKAAMTAAAARTTEAVDAALTSALHDVTPGHIAGWFRDRAAYAVQR
jgi:hypothetical protein